MSDEPTSYVRALADEYRRVSGAGLHHVAICAAEDLTRHGWNVNEAGELVRIQERAVVKPAPETPEQPAPRRKAAAPKE